MLSENAILDIQDLEGEGITLTPSEIVTLNELGLRVERSANSGDINCAPRIGWAGDTPIFEPTLQSEAWIDTYANRWFQDDPETFTACVLFACAHAQIQGFFQRSELTQKASTIDCIKDWHSQLPCTSQQLQQALQFALVGCDSGSDIYPEPAEHKTESRPVEDFRTLVIDTVLASGMGLSLNDLQLMTESRVLGLLKKYQANQGIEPKANNYRAHADYARTLCAIRKKHLEVK